MVVSTEQLSVLLVEDDEDDYVITRDMLGAQDRARFKLEWSAGYDEALTVIREQRHDVYLVDYRLGGRTGLELVREAFTSGPLAPVPVAVTGLRSLGRGVAWFDTGTHGSLSPTARGCARAS